jgi:hypothetical protein
MIWCWAGGSTVALVCLCLGVLRLFLESQLVSAAAVPIEPHFVHSGKAERGARPNPGQGRSMVMLF